MRTWQLTGELKAKICPLVEAMYGFEESFDETSSTTKNHGLVAQLKMNLGFCYKVSSSHLICSVNQAYIFRALDPVKDKPWKGLYQHPIIQKVANIAFYANKRDEGVRYPQHFSPFPLTGMALLLTVVQMWYVC